MSRSSLVENPMSVYWQALHWTGFFGFPYQLVNSPTILRLSVISSIPSFFSSSPVSKFTCSSSTEKFLKYHHQVPKVSLCMNVYILAGSTANQEIYHHHPHNNSRILDSLGLINISQFTCRKFRLGGSFREKKKTTNMAHDNKKPTEGQQIPILTVRGTHYVIGYTIGRRFRNIIDDLVNKWTYLNDILIPLYKTYLGRLTYDKTLKLCSLKFPQYVDELKGMSDGAKVPFFKIFLLHIDTLIVPATSKRSDTGSTTLLTNNDQVILGHSEDAVPELAHNMYILSAEIIDDNGDKLEKFRALAYAGFLPGFAMGYNEHGLIYSVNSLLPSTTEPNKTPRVFLARALLSASNFVQVEDILRDYGTGCADGFSVNISFAKQEGSPVMHNVEVGPCREDRDESDLSVLTLTHGDFHAHCNKYLRLHVEECSSSVAVESSNHRHKTIGRHLRANTEDRVKEVLSDQADTTHPVFRTVARKTDLVKTVASGVFDILQRKWSIYVEPPQKSAPAVEFLMEF